MNYQITLKIFLGFILWINSVHGQSNEKDTCESFARQCLTEMTAVEDILPQICHHLNMQDLQRTRLVCSLFNEVANRVLRQRGPDLIALQVKQSFLGQPKSEHVSKLLKIRPQTAVFFTNNKRPEDFYCTISDEIFARFFYELPPSIQIIHVAGLGVILNDRPIDIYHNYAVGLFLPEPRPEVSKVRDFAIREYFVMDEGTHHYIEAFIENIFDIPSNNLHKKHYGMILLNTQFGMSDVNPVDSSMQKSSFIVKEAIRKRIQEIPASFALWGSNVRHLKALNLNGYNSVMLSSFITRISSSKAQCWSIAIDLTESHAQNNQRIRNFRNDIRISNEKSIGLALVTVQRLDSESQVMNKIKLLRSYFSGLNLMGFGIDDKLPKYCYNTLESLIGSSDGPVITYDQNFICFMVITYV